MASSMEIEIAMEEEDEIYDDVLSVQENNDMSGLRDIRSKFENADTNKPLPAEKPHVPIGNKPIANRWDGGGKFKTVENPKSPTSANHFVTPARDTDRNVVSTRSNSPTTTARRDSKVDIPSIFQTQQTTPKPKPTPKPLVPKKTSDTNNNTRNDIQKEMATGVHKQVQRPVPLARKPGGNSTDTVNGLPSTPLRSNRTDSEPNTPARVTSPTDKLPSMRTGSVAAMASMLGGKIPTDVANLKAGLRPVHAAEQRSIVKPLSPRSEGASINEIKKHIQLRSGSSIKASNKAQRRCVKSLIRKGDGIKFHKIEIDTIDDSGSVLDKPAKLNISLDIEVLTKDFDSLLTTLDDTDHGWQEVEEEYDDIGNVRPPIDRIVSLIQPMTEDDEDQWKGAGFTGLPPESPPNDVQQFDDVKPGDEIAEEYYEPLPDEFDEPPPLPSSKPNLDPPTDTQADTHSQTDVKELEKERKKKEKEEKKRQDQLEKELKQKQRDLQQLLKKYKISAESLEAVVGTGTVKATKKAHKLDIAVTVGDKVDVVRMVDNQKGKWLIRVTETQKVGYVDAANIEVEPQIIRGIMDGSFTEQSPVTPTTPHPSLQNDVGGEEVYEDVDGEAGANGDLQEDEIYEECGP